MKMQATPAKLKSGDWGARVRNAQVSPGDIMQITAKSGKTWSATVSRVLWRGDGVALVATRQSGGNGYARRNGRGYTDRYGNSYCGYPCPVSGLVCNSRNGPCHDCL